MAIGGPDGWTAAGSRDLTRRQRTRVLTLSAALAVMAGGCTSSSPTTPGPPVLVVVTALDPLQMAVAQIGQSRVEVTDPVPNGANPLSYQLPPAAATMVSRAGLAVGIGGGFQPSFESAARQARRAVFLLTGSGRSNPYVWLDPKLMQNAVAQLAAAMEAANPPAAALYRQGERAFSDILASTGIDYSSTLSTCLAQTMFTPDQAFSAMAGQYGLKDVVLAGPGATARVEGSDATTVFAETWADDRTVEAAAGAAHLRVRVLDTLLGPPAGGWPDRATYIDRLEANLGTLTAGLNCSAGANA